MSKMSDLMIDLQEAIENGDSFEVIAKQFNVPLRWVLDAAEAMDVDADPGDMDGDHASALASAGFGTDEDYFYVMENDYDDSF
jgi:hypothetical protein